MLHASRNCPLHLSRTLYKSALFMQNKPNLLDAKMNVNSLVTMNYKNFIPLAGQKNKPNSNPIAERVKLMQSLYLQRIIKKNAAKGYEKTKPKQTQFAKRLQLMQSLYLQRIMKKYADMGCEKTKPKQTQFKSEYRGQRSDVCLRSSVLCSRMSEITCFWQLQFRADSDNIVELKKEYSCLLQKCRAGNVRLMKFKELKV